MPARPADDAEGAIDMRAVHYAISTLALAAFWTSTALRQQAIAAANTQQLDRGRTVDFISILPKRGDLRTRVIQVGFDAAYAEWSGQPMPATQVSGESDPEIDRGKMLDFVNV